VNLNAFYSFQIAKLLAASGRELRRALFSLKQIFQVGIVLTGLKIKH